MSSPDLFSDSCNSRKESPERSNVSSEQMVLPSIPAVLLKLPALAMTQLKSILEQSYQKKQKKKKKKEEEKKVLKSYEIEWNNLKRLLISIGIRDFKSTPASTKNAWCVTERPVTISSGQSKARQGLKDFPMFWRKISLIEFSWR